MVRPGLNDVLVNNADWALAAKNMAVTTHSLVGAVATQRRTT
jgi:hypothetical protein